MVEEAGICEGSIWIERLVGRASRLHREGQGFESPPGRLKRWSAWQKMHAGRLKSIQTNR